MDDRAEFDNSMKEAPGSLKESYAGLREGISTFFKATIKEETSRRWQSRLRVPGFEKSKDKRTTDTLTHVQEVFQIHFPNPDDQRQVAEGANQFLHKLATSINSTEREVVELDEPLDQFIATFPDNMLTPLGNQATADTVRRIFQVGSDAIDNHMRRVAETPDDLRRGLGNFINGRLGWISKMLVEDLPDAVRNAGEKKEMLLADFETIAKSKSFRELDSMAKFYKEGFYEPSPLTQENISKLSARIQEINPQADTSTTPFNRLDREPWKGERELVMGTESRAPIWKDLADMALSTEEDDIEFGMIFSRDPQDRNLRIDFKRGTKTSIHNKGDHRGRKDLIFFHSHPSTTSGKELVAPLVSQGDLEGTIMQDGGGKYYNVATINGVTFHTGIAVDNPPAVELTEADSLRPVYTIESGIQAGNWYMPGEYAKTTEIMQGIQDEGKPFEYSIYDPGSKRRHYFVHIPWDTIDGSVPFEEVCYGSGLSDIVGKINSLPKIPMAQNVLEGLNHVA